MGGLSEVRMIRGQTVKAFFLVAILSVFAADISVGCGQGYVYGIVNQKISNQSGGPDRQLVINSETYDVPVSFYNVVQVGDAVRFTGGNWTIVKRATAPPPASSSP